MAFIIKPPDQLNLKYDISIFLAGTIDLGNSDDWQTKLSNEFDMYDVNLFNPRRVVYEEVDIKEQINWELDAMEIADIIVVHLESGSKSPVTMLEIGLHAHDEKLIVHCPKDFWRYDNIKITCERYNVTFTEDYDEFIYFILEKYKKIKILTTKNSFCFIPNCFSVCFTNSSTIDSFCDSFETITVC